MADGVTVTVTVTGLAELEQKLERLKKKFAKKELRSAMRLGGKVLQDKVEELAPKDTGELSEHIGLKTKATDGEDGNIQVMVAPEKGDAFYGLFQELGTRFQPAQPYMRPALLESKDDIVNVVKEALAEKLLKYDED